MAALTVGRLPEAYGKRRQERARDFIAPLATELLDGEAVVSSF